MEKQFVMKPWNEDIEISIPVDSIAQQLLATMHESNPHRELIIYNIIGYMKADNKLGKLYSALNGYHKEINIELNKKYMCDTKHLNFYSCSRPVGELCVKVTKIDTFADQPVTVKYSYTRNDDSQTTTTCTVSIASLTEIVE